MTERRKQRRMRLGHLFTLNVFNAQTGELVQLKSSDLSRMGVNFEELENHKFSIGDDIDFRLQSFAKPSLYLPIEAKVKWIDKGRIGTEFLRNDLKSLMWIEHLCAFIETVELIEDSDSNL